MTDRLQTTDDARETAAYRAALREANSENARLRVKLERIAKVQDAGLARLLASEALTHE